MCAACHKINDFTGGRFRVVWVGRTVGDLFETISTLMPEGDPGSLSPDEYSAIISYLLRENGYPPGEEDLADDASTLQEIRIVVGSVGQEVQTFCDQCQSTYVSAEDVLVIPAGTGHQFTRIDDHIRYVMIRIDPDKVVPLMDEADSREYLRNR